MTARSSEPSFWIYAASFYFRCPWGASSWCIGARTLKLRWSRPPCFPRRWSPISLPIVKLYQNTTTLSLSRTWPFPSFMAHGCLTCFFSTVLFCLFLFRGFKRVKDNWVFCDTFWTVPKQIIFLFPALGASLVRWQFFVSQAAQFLNVKFASQNKFRENKSGETFFPADYPDQSIIQFCETPNTKI